MRNKSVPINILVISDIHGNKEALQEVEKYLKKHQVEQIVCLGDVVGYGVDFEWCLNWLNKQNAIILEGNHESMIIGETPDDKCSDIGKQAVEWTKRHMNDMIRQQIAHLPRVYEYKNINFTHAGYSKNPEWIYIQDLNDALKAFGDNGMINFFGHTHRACVISQKGEKIVLDKRCRLILSLDHRYYINPGSVGQNRGDKTRLVFMTLEIHKDKMILNYLVKKYKSYKTFQKLQECGMDQRISEYLIRERWRRKLYKGIYKISTFNRRAFK